MTVHRVGEPVDVLLVEDNPGDVRLTEEAFEEGRVTNDLHVVADGEEALDFLFGRGAYRDSPTPELVLLDMNVPTVGGRAVLEEIRNDPDLQSLPVVVLTNSEAEEDVVRSYDLQLDAYLTKPVEPDDIVDLVRRFDEFWFTLVRIPPDEE